MKKTFSLFSLLFALIFFASCYAPAASTQPSSSSTSIASPPLPQSIAPIPVPNILSDITFVEHKISPPDWIKDSVISYYNNAMFVHFPEGSDVNDNGAFISASLVVPEDILLFRPEATNNNIAKFGFLNAFMDITINFTKSGGGYSFVNSDGYTATYTEVEQGVLQFGTCFIYKDYFLYVTSFTDGNPLAIMIHKIVSQNDTSVEAREFGHLFVEDGAARGWPYVQYILDTIRVEEL